MWSGGTEIEASAARLSGYLKELACARFALLIWIAACGSAGAAYVFLSPAQFIARVDVVIGPRAVANDGPEDVRHFHQIDIDAEQAATELWVMSSDRVLGRVFADLNLGGNRELTSNNNGLLPFVAHLAHNFISGGSSDDARERAYSAFANRVLCLRVGGSYVFEFSYRSHDAGLAARIANALASAYLSDRLERERQRRIGVRASYQVGRDEALARELHLVRAAEEGGMTPAQDVYSASARILGPATPPLRKSFPKMAPTLLLSLAIGLISGIVAVLARAAAQTAPEARRVAPSGVRRGQRLAESLD